jgi:UDP-glucose 4-epimerase
MKTLVTGGAGFIGSNLVDLLIQNDHDVIIIDNLLTGKEANLNGNAKFYNADVRNKLDLDKIFKKENPEIIFHLAAQVDVQKAIKDPYFDAQINILGSLNVLELAKKYNIKKIIYSNSGGAGSGEPQYLPIDEDHPIKPMSHYGVGKHTAEHYLDVYRELYGLTYTSLRYANIYGPRQDPYGEGGVVAIFSNKLLHNEQPKIFGDGNQTRDFMYVGDVAKVNLLCIDSADNKILNVGTGVEITINDLFNKVKKITKSNLDPIYLDKRPGDIYRSVFNIDKLKRELNYEPRTSLEDGLIKTIEYFNQ